MSQSLPPSPLRPARSKPFDFHDLGARKPPFQPFDLGKASQPLEKEEDGQTQRGTIEDQSDGEESDDSFNSALGSPSSVPQDASAPGSPASDSDSDKEELEDLVGELGSPTISKHPFAHATKIEVLHDHGVIDIEEEVRAHAALRRAASEDAMHERYASPARSNTTSNTVSVRPRRRRRSPSPAPTSIMLADNSGQSAAFARDVHIPGWTCVGAGPGGYVVYECVVATRERPDSFSRACPSDTPSAPSARSRTVSNALPPTATPGFTTPTPTPKPPTHRRQKSTPGPTIRVYKRYSEFAALDSELRQTLPMSARAHVPPLPPANALARFRPRFLASRRAQLEAWLMRVLLHPDIGGTRVVREWMCV